MKDKSGMQWQDYGLLTVIFLCLALFVGVAAQSSYAYYKRAEEQRALQSAKVVTKSLTPNLAQAESISRELAQTTVDENGRVTNFAKRSQQLAAINYVQGLYLVTAKGSWRAASGVNAEMRAAYAQFSKAAVRAYAVRKHSVVMQGPVTLKGGETGLIFYRPVFVKKQLWGFAIVAVKADLLLKASLENLDQWDFNYRLFKSSVSSRNYRLMTRSKAAVDQPVTYRFRPSKSSGTWKIYVSPKGGWSYRNRSLRVAVYAALLAVCLFVLAVVMTMRQAGMRRLKKEATMDALTQISNRLGFDQQLDRFLAEHEGASFTLAMIDVDDFKLFNDLYGHQVGDQVLKQVARGLEEAVAGRGLVGRTGGDEFMLALLGLDAAASQPVIQQILTAEHQIVYQGQRINYSLSIGYADSPKHGRQLSSLVRRADEALYEVKLSGKSGAQYYSGENSRPLRAQLGFTLHDIAANIPAALLIYRPENGRILFVNQGTLRLLGYDNLWDFFGKVNTRAIHVVAPADLDRVKVWLDRFTAEAAVGDIHKLNYRVVTQDGKEVAVKANFSMVDNPHYGKLVYQTLTTA